MLFFKHYAILALYEKDILFSAEPFALQFGGLVAR